MLSFVTKEDVEVCFDKNKSDGFSWRYLDLIDDRGNGLVFIWSLGLPFLDRSKYVQKKSSKKTPRAAINIVVYQNFKQVFYLLQEYDTKDVTWSPNDGVWQFQKTKINLVKLQSHSSDGHEKDFFRLFINLHMEIPNSKDILQGEIQCEGQFLHASNYDPPGEHNWSLLAANIIGNAQLQAGKQSFQLTGRMYFDQNCSTTPITDLGIAKWFWGRFSFQDFEWIVYVVDSESDSNTVKILLRLDKDGNIKIFDDFTISDQGTKSSIYGLQYPEIMHIHADEILISISLGHKVDDSPFYQRFMVISHFENQSGVGFVEQVVPSKIGISWQQPFVRMKVHHLNAPNSFWLPLFTGDLTGSFLKLLSKVLLPN